MKIYRSGTNTSQSSLVIKMKLVRVGDSKEVYKFHYVSDVTMKHGGAYRIIDEIDKMPIEFRKSYLYIDKLICGTDNRLYRVYLDKDEDKINEIKIKDSNIDLKFDNTTRRVLFNRLFQLEDQERTMFIKTILNDPTNNEKSVIGWHKLITEDEENKMKFVGNGIGYLRNDIEYLIISELYQILIRYYKKCLEQLEEL